MHLIRILLLACLHRCGKRAVGTCYSNHKPLRTPACKFKRLPLGQVGAKANKLRGHHTCSAHADEGIGFVQASVAHIAGIRQYITNEYMHSGLRDDGPHIFERLLGMTRGTIPMF